MLNTFNKIFKLFLLFSAVISGWTSIILLSNTNFNLEINEVIKKMYRNQSNFILNVKELSILLVKDANERFSEINHDSTKFGNNDDVFKK